MSRDELMEKIRNGFQDAKRIAWSFSASETSIGLCVLHKANDSVMFMWNAGILSYSDYEILSAEIGAIISDFLSCES